MLVTKPFLFDPIVPWQHTILYRCEPKSLRLKDLFRSLLFLLCLSREPL